MIRNTVARLRIRMLNRVSVAGAARDIQFGYSNDEPCLQFQIVTSCVDNQPSLGEPVATEPLVRRSENAVKQQFTVRYALPPETDPTFVEQRNSVTEGALVRCVGKLKHNIQVDHGKKTSFPFISIRRNDGVVEQLRVSPVKLKAKNSR